MTREEAIDVFEGLDELEAISLFYQRGGKADGLSIHRIKEAGRMAIAAFRAQQTNVKLDRSRWDGCAHCENWCCCTCKYSTTSETKYPCKECDEERYDPQNFCPHCGRPPHRGSLGGAGEEDKRWN